MISSDGAGRRAISRVLKDMYGVADEHTRVNMSGKTDPQILQEILNAAKIPAQDIPDAIEKVLDVYLTLLEAEILAAKYYIVHEGVYELIEAIGNHSEMYLGLLTGNVERGARMKLDQFGLNKHFAIGAYGSDSANRLELPKIAQQRAQLHFKLKFEPQDLVIIGDSVNDIRCAQGFGAKCIAVNTGKTPWDELDALMPEYLFKSLSDTEAVMNAILAPMPTASVQQISN